MPRPAEEPRTLSDAAFQRLKADIVSGALKPGAKLKIGDLVARYNVGASPLREALARLSSDHLVVLEGQRGFTVAPISKREVLDLSHVRQLIEADAVALSIEHGDVEWEARVVAAYFRLQKAQAMAEAAHEWSEGWESCNRLFHEALISACGSIWLLRLQQLLYVQSVRYRFLSFNQPQPPRDGDAEHKALMEACLARDAARARQLTASHIARTAATVAAALPDDEAVPTSRVMRVMAGEATRSTPDGSIQRPGKRRSTAGKPGTQRG